MATITATNGLVEIPVADGVPEGTPFSCDVLFKDSDGTAYTPTNLTMRVIDGDGTEIEAESELAEATTVAVTTAAATNDLGDDDDGRRVIVLDWTAITDRHAAPGIAQTCEISYPIIDMLGKPSS